MDYSSPTPAPTALYTIQLSLTLTGITCDLYGRDEEKAVKRGLAAVIDFVDFGDISNTTCASARRQLLASGVTLSMSVSIGASSPAAAAALTTSLTSQLASAVSDGSLAAAIVANAVPGSNMDGATLTITGYSAALVTPSPVTSTVTAGAASVKPYLTAFGFVAASLAFC